MKFFVDTAGAVEIRSLGGLTTTPFLVAKSGKKFTDKVRGIEVIGPARAEFMASDFGMVREVAVPREIRPIGARPVRQSAGTRVFTPR